jgi:hypothetical protein
MPAKILISVFSPNLRRVLILAVSVCTEILPFGFQGSTDFIMQETEPISHCDTQMLTAHSVVSETWFNL